MDDAGSMISEEAGASPLSQALAALKEVLRPHTQDAVAPAAAAATAVGDAGLPALAHLAEAFGLSPFECELLLLCAGTELDQEIAPLCGAVQGDAARCYPTFGLALTIFSDAHWSAMTPAAPLRYWRLIEPSGEPQLTVARLRLDERILHFLIGVSGLDERLAPLLQSVVTVGGGDLAPSHRVILDQVVRAWSAVSPGDPTPAIQLCGDPAECRAIAAAAAAALGRQGVTVAADLVPGNAGELDSFLRLLEREVRLGEIGAVLIENEADDPAGGEAQHQATVGRIAERLRGPVILCRRERCRIMHRPSLSIDVAHPPPVEQRAAWHAALDASVAESGLAMAVDAICAQFNLPLATIRQIAREAEAATDTGQAVGPALWELCRVRLRARLDTLAQRIQSSCTWNDLVLPKAEAATLSLIAAQLRQRLVVYEHWGFAAKSERGLGISALFAGPSGTGKTMAAEVLAAELRLD